MNKISLRCDECSAFDGLACRKNDLHAGLNDGQVRVYRKFPKEPFLFRRPDMPDFNALICHTTYISSLLVAMSRVLGFLRRGQVLYELEKPRTQIGRAASNDIVLEAQV